MNDLSSSINDVSSASRDSESSYSRDEVREVRNLSRKEDRSVQLWRLALLFLIQAIGVTVSGLTYHFLRTEETHALSIAYDQFTDALGNAAIRQQEDMRNAFHSFETIISNYAYQSNKTWPFVSLPLFESYGGHTLQDSGCEVFALFPIVKREEKEDWFRFAGENYESMVKEGHMIETGSLDDLQEIGYHPYFTAPTPDGFVPDIDREIYFPMWHYSPPPFSYGNINWNLESVPEYDDLVDSVLNLKYELLVSSVRKYVTVGTALLQEEHAQMHSEINDSSPDYPHSFVYHPIHLNAQDSNSPIVALVGAGFAWDFSLMHLLPENVVGIQAIIKNNCDQSFTYEINGPDALYLGPGDMHKTDYDDYERIVNLALHSHPDFESTPGHCQYTMHLYPDSNFVQLYHTSSPMIYSLCVAGSFACMIFVFYIYNWFVNQRNEILINNAARSNAVITSLFPDNIRKKLIGDESPTNDPRTFHDFLAHGSDPTTDLTRPPLADYFATATVMFADICGFTAWSSVREPPQVFTLLETVYGAFDRLTRRSRVFKVETVGDSYVAATGIPDYHREHAVFMVKFAHKISREMSKLTKQLETTLGPDTGDLLLRIGIHSGPVTAGVLRGEKCRFQLFGDTVNVASRMESTGVGGRIHVSQETAELLRKCCRSHWLIRRHDKIAVKGKGEIQTYWIGKAIERMKDDPSYDTTSETAPGSSRSFQETQDHCPIAEQLSNADGREDRLVDWNVTVFVEILRQIVSRRNALDASSREYEYVRSDEPYETDAQMDCNYQPLDYVREIITLPEFNHEVAESQQDPHTVFISNIVISELRDYISTIAGLYRSNPFHNFEHASHVTMSVIKLLSRIKAPTELELMEDEVDEENQHDFCAHLHDHTYGITSDPLTQFACAFAALVHDVDHQGVPNAQLVKEEATVAAKYKNRSVAEQNSLVLSWNLFMSARFANLRKCLCSTPEDLCRFRQLTVNAVMATDIVDGDLKQLRNDRWDKAFSHRTSQELRDESRDDINRKATIVIEHLLQASDISHTMQHWHVYRKWNELFFHECYAAFASGRSDNDPSLSWYKGEIGFFDFYIIPLAKKLESCGVFGKSSDEFLNYAKSNREEWENRGEQIVAEMVEALKNEDHDYQ